MCNNAELIEYIHIETNENKPTEKKVKKVCNITELIEYIDIDTTKFNPLKPNSPMRAKVFSSREIVRILHANNYIAVSRKGSHIKYYNETTRQSFVLTTDKEVNPMIWRRIVKTYNIVITM